MRAYSRDKKHLCAIKSLKKTSKTKTANLAFAKNNSKASHMGFSRNYMLVPKVI